VTSLLIITTSGRGRRAHEKHGPQQLPVLVALGSHTSDGTGVVNPRGLSFYDRLVDSLLACGIEPFVTLFHWDMPSALFRMGGWSNPDVADWFGDYAAVVVGALGDRVRYWMTLNEPYVVSAEGHLVGNHAPGMRNIYQMGHSVHHQLRLTSPATGH